MSLLRVQDLKKHFPVRKGFFRREVGSIKAVDGISFEIGKGEVLGMVGESGCGKSTAGRSAIRLIEPTAGQIEYCGQDLRTLTKPELRQWRKKVQMIFQNPYASLNPRKTVAENIGEALLVHGLVKTEKERNVRVSGVLERVGLPDSALNCYPHQFSGGQQQRIAIGRAIALEPELIICDEAVSALDVSVQAQILELLKELQTDLGLSYLFISHDLSVVRHICDRVVVLYLGKVMESAPTDQLFADPRHPYTQALLSAVPKEHPDEKRERLLIPGDLPSPIDPPKGCPFHTRCPYAQEECRQKPPPKKGDEHTTYCIL